MNGRCELFDTAGTLSDDPNTDFYKSTCAGATAGGGTPGIQTICNFDGMKIVVTVYFLFTLLASPKSRFILQFNKDSAFSGAIFAKMKYDTCRTEVKDATMAMLLLGFPNADSSSPCGRPGGSSCGGGGGGGGGYGPPPPAQSGGYGGGSPGGSAGYGSAQQTGGGCSSAGGCSGRVRRQSYGAQPPAPPTGGYGGGQQQQLGPQQQSGKGGGGVFGPPTLPPRDCGVIDLVINPYSFLSLFVTK